MSVQGREKEVELSVVCIEVVWKPIWEYDLAKKMSVKAEQKKITKSTESGWTPVYGQSVHGADV